MICPHCQHEFEPEKKKRFVAPTAKEVTDYAMTIGFKLDGELFVNHYEANGWKRGKTPIKCWQACVRTWKINHNSDKPQVQQATHRLVKLRCSNCSWEINTKIEINRDVDTIHCKNCQRGHLQEVL